MLDLFEVLVSAEYLRRDEKEVAVRSFADFFHNVTPKHKKRLHLNWLYQNPSDMAVLTKLLNNHEVPRQNFSLNTNKEKTKVLKRSSLLLHPSTEHYKSVIPEALSFGLPILTLEGKEVEAYVEVSCGMTVEAGSQEQRIEDFTKMLSILYFDQEVLKILEKGAANHFERNFSWGLKQFRKYNY